VGPSQISEVVDGGVRDRTIDPQDLGIERSSLDDLRGGSPAENAAAIRRVFAGEPGGAREAILLNAAGAIAAGGHADDLREGIVLARETLDSGAAAARLDELVEFTRG
jgi:anthranilate phosphoribosyltransferase